MGSLIFGTPVLTNYIKFGWLGFFPVNFSLVAGSVSAKNLKGEGKCLFPSLQSGADTFPSAVACGSGRFRARRTEATLGSFTFLLPHHGA